jgi:hypothetical protein
MIPEKVSLIGRLSSEDRRSKWIDQKMSCFTCSFTYKPEIKVTKICDNCGIRQKAEKERIRLDQIVKVHKEEKVCKF